MSDEGTPGPAREARISDQERAAWQAACDAATPGPWQIEQAETELEFIHWRIYTRDPQPDAPWAPRLIAWLSGMVRQGGVFPGVNVCPTCHYARARGRRVEVPFDVRWDDQTQADATFIVRAREALPRLLAENAALREAVRCWQQTAENAHGAYVTQPPLPDPPDPTAPQQLGLLEDGP